MIDPLTLIPTGVILLPISWMWVRLSNVAKRMDDTYTKSETKEMIDLKNQPIKDALDRNTEVSRDLSQAIKELKQELGRLTRE